MNAELMATGDLVTGSLAAHAVDSATGARRTVAQGQCLNCGTALTGPHCHACGQSGHIHRSMGAIWHDIAHGVFHFEGKAFRTLPLLILRPGELTRRYIDGERTRFVSPLALFLFSVFAMFAVISLLGGSFSAPVLTPPQQAAARAQIAPQLAEARASLARLDAPEGRGNRSAQDIAYERIALTATIEGLERATRGIPAPLTDASKLKTGWDRLDKGIAKAEGNPSLLVYKLQSSAYKFSWALIPLSVPFVWLLFLWRRGHHIYDHSVFVTYSLAFMTLLVIALSLMGAAGLAVMTIPFIATFAPPLHMYKQLRGTYRLSRFSAAWRMVLLLSFAFTALITFLLLLLGMGLVG